MYEMSEGKQKSLWKICEHVCEGVSDKDKEREEFVFSYADHWRPSKCQSAPSD